ncbi:hypothetical protein [Dyadobacter sp. CY351]|uniref:hypothetical protein n=1 Tax=Dyadobacter sp. CY351 TaxID=2909337 RepID=UPI001F4121FB|nr:hypothetical protein [Dyadobacter sp. CY351]MCF2520671.1 hypothetical protein [Dyadobacter sp. CY351]
MLKRILIFCMVVVATSSCEKDKEKPCVAPVFGKNIIGTWTGNFELTPKIKAGLTFSENGQFEDTGGLLFGNKNESPLTWTVKGDSLKITGKFKDKGIKNYSFSALTNTCDSIVLDVEGIDKIFLKRK